MSIRLFIKNNIVIWNKFKIGKNAFDKNKKKGKKGNGIGGKKLLKEIEKRNQLAFNKDKEKNCSKIHY